MTPPKKKKLTVWTIVARITALLIVIGIAYTGMVAIAKFGEDRANIESRIFTTPDMRLKTEAKTNAIVDEVTLSWKQDTLSKRTDTMIRQQRKLDTALLRNNRLFDSLLNSNLKRDSTYKSNQIILQMGRNNRENKIDQLLIKVDEILNKEGNE